MTTLAINLEFLSTPAVPAGILHRTVLTLSGLRLSRQHKCHIHAFMEIRGGTPAHVLGYQVREIKYLGVVLGEKARVSRAA